MNPAFVFVETLEGVTAARALRPVRIGTDNPLLAHDPRAGGDVADMSRHLEQTEASRLGCAAVDILLKLDEALEQNDAAAHFGGRSAPLHITMALRALISTLLQRGVMAQRALAECGDEPLILIAPDHPRWFSNAPWNTPRFGCIHRALAEAGFFGNRSVEFQAVTFQSPTDYNDTAIDDPLLRLLLVPSPQIAFEAARRLHLVRLFAAQGQVAVGKTCEAIKETLPWLAARGVGVQSFRMPTPVGDNAPPFGVLPPTDPWLQKYAEPILLKELRALNVLSEAATRAIAAVTLQHLAAGLAALGRNVKAIGDELDKVFGVTSDGGILMTNGVYGPLGAQLHSLCRQRKITLVNFEHGATTGIAAYAEQRLKVSESTTTDILMASSPRAARSFARAPGKSCDIKVVGLADQSRSIRFRSLQRWRARSRLKLRPGEITVMHVSTLLYGGNMRSGADAPVEHYVYETETRLLGEVYPRVEKTVLYKPYPAQRFPHEVSYSELIALQPNVRLIPWADFRYIRAAADIVVTTANSSTIGWCIGADVPLVHLGSLHVNALANDDLRDEFSRSFFSIDMDREDWPERLVALLNRDIGELRSEWRSKRPDRDRFVTDAISGPHGSVGRRAARIVAKIHG